MNEMTNVKPAKPVTTGNTSEPFAWLRQEIDRLFDGFGRPMRAAFDAGLGTFAPAPAMEMLENADSYRLTAEVPGLDGDDISVSLADGVLTISGDIKNEREEHDEGFMLRERRYGSFQRSITLPADADASDITAKVKRGVLTIMIGKDAEAASRTRVIKVEKD